MKTLDLDQVIHYTSKVFRQDKPFWRETRLRGGCDDEDQRADD
jgi:hypothetical protein